MVWHCPPPLRVRLFDGVHCAGGRNGRPDVCEKARRTPAIPGGNRNPLIEMGNLRGRRKAKESELFGYHYRRFGAAPYKGCKLQSKQDTPPRVPDKAQKAVATAKGTSGLWFILVGSFPERHSAASAARKLGQKGHDVYVLETEVNGKKQHRVEVGRLASREEAVSLQQVLKQKENFSRTIVAKQ